MAKIRPGGQKRDVYILQVVGGVDDGSSLVFDFCGRLWWSLDVLTSRYGHLLFTLSMCHLQQIPPSSHFQLTGRVDCPPLSGKKKCKNDFLNIYLRRAIPQINIHEKLKKRPHETQSCWPCQ